MPKVSTFANVLASQIVDSDRIPIISNAGDNKLLPISEARNAVGPGWSATVNAYNEAGATDEIKIQAAITRAVSTGASRVFIPSSMYPYDASLITFNTAIQMVREGGNFDVYDIQAYGAVGDGSADNSEAIQAAIDAAFVAGGWTVYIPAATGFYSYATTLANDRGVSIKGSGINSSILSYTGSGVGITCLGTGIGDWWYCTFADFCLRTPNSTAPYTGSTYGFKIADANGIVFRQVRALHWGTAAVNLDGTDVCVSHVFDIVTFELNKGGIYVTGANGRVNHVGIRNSQIRNNEEYHVYSPVEVRCWQLMGTNLEAGKVAGVRFDYATSIELGCNYFEQVTAVPCIILADVQPGAGISIHSNGLAGSGLGNGASAVKIGVGGGVSNGVGVSNNFISGWSKGVEYNGAGIGIIGPNSISDVTLPYKPALSGNLGVTVFDTAGQRGQGGSPSADRGDASVTLVPGTDWKIQRFNTVLTATRTVTLATTDSHNGDSFKILRQASATGAFNIDVGSGPLKSLTAANQWVEVTFDAYWTQAWSVTGYGTL